MSNSLEDRRKPNDEVHYLACYTSSLTYYKKLILLIIHL